MYVLPAPVCPYAKTVPLYPVRTLSQTSAAHVVKMVSWLASGRTSSKRNLMVSAVLLMWPVPLGLSVFLTWTATDLPSGWRLWTRCGKGGGNGQMYARVDARGGCRNLGRVRGGTQESGSLFFRGPGGKGSGCGCTHVKEPWTLSVGRVRRYTFTELAMVADGLLNANRGAPASLETGSQRDPVLGVSPVNLG